MNRVVFRLSGQRGPDMNQYVAISLEEPADLADAGWPFPCRPDEEPFAHRAVPPTAGNLLFEGVTKHPQLTDHLKAARISDAERYPVYVDIGPTSGAEVYPWEALRFPDGPYLSLDRKIALARMVRSSAPVVDFYTLEPPVRIAAVLSCLGVSAAEELAALREVAAEFGPGRAELLVIASEEQLVEGLRSEIEAGTASPVTDARYVPPDAEGLGDLLSEFGPHVLHLFCHGSTESTPHLQIALRNDWDHPTPGAGLTLEAQQFHLLKRRVSDKPWLVVLNCCEGAAPPPGVEGHSLAFSLAFQGVAPVVIGMREPVTAPLASTVTRRLYTRLAHVLSACLDGPAMLAPMDWAAMLVPVRSALVQDLYPGRVFGEAADSTLEWTLPVLYVPPREFRLQTRGLAGTETLEREDAPANFGGAAAEASAGRSFADEEQPAPPLPTDGSAEALRVARLELIALRTLRRDLPEGQAPALRAGIEARIAELSHTLGLEGMELE